MSAGTTSITSERDLAHAIDTALEDLLRFDPVKASRVGHHAHDGTFADFSAAGRRARRRALAGHAHSLEGKKGADADNELDRRLMLDEIKVVLRTEEDINPPCRNPALYTREVLDGINLLLMRPPLQPRLGALLGRLREISRVLDQAREELDPPDVPRVWAETGIAMARAGLSLLTEAVPAAVHEAVGDTPLHAAVGAAAGEAALALGRYANFVEEHVLPAAGGDFAAGDSYFTFLLHNRHGILQSPEELLHLGQREVERLSAALSEAAGRLRPATSGDWRRCLRELDAEGGLPEGRTAVDACRDLTARARRALVESGMCPLPEGESLLVQPTPAFARPTIPFAAYWPPPPLAPESPEFKEGLRGVYWVTPDSRVSLPELLLTCVHEGYPGHHLQLCYAARTGSRVRRVIGTPVFWEGWALYCESLMGELGLSDDATALYVLRNQLWRAYRVVLDVGLHCQGRQNQKLTYEQAVTTLSEGVGFSREQAEAEVRRYVATPTQPLSYLVGYQAFVHLRQEAERREGAAFRLPDFHLRLLRHGSIPLGYLHERMR